ncbi:MAG: hypothetical protein LQ338_006981, partial [Usnochroma carphineum]
MAPLSKDDLRILEQARQRLYQLTDSLNSLNRDIHSSHPLPSWYIFPLSFYPFGPRHHQHSSTSTLANTFRSSLTSRFSILANQLSSLSAHLATYEHLFSALVVYPTEEFPGREQEGMVVQMLRKKLEPGVEGWVEGGLEAGREGVGGDGGISKEGWKELWEGVMLRANEEARGYAWGEDEEEEEEEGEEGGERMMEGEEDWDKAE